MDNKKTVAFTGHRPQSLPWGFDEQTPSCIVFKKRLQEEIEEAICDGYCRFITGMAMGIDLMAAQIVLNLKNEYPHITLECAVPYENQAENWSVEQREIYYNILSQSDKTHMISQQYSPKSYESRNKYMVEQTDLIIAVFHKNKSGTGQTISFAKKAGKKIIIIDPVTCQVA